MKLSSAKNETKMDPNGSEWIAKAGRESSTEVGGEVRGGIPDVLQQDAGLDTSPAHFLGRRQVKWGDSGWPVQGSQWEEPLVQPGRACGCLFSGANSFSQGDQTPQGL